MDYDDDLKDSDMVGFHEVTEDDADFFEDEDVLPKKKSIDDFDEEDPLFDKELDDLDEETEEYHY